MVRDRLLHLFNFFQLGYARLVQLFGGITEAGPTLRRSSWCLTATSARLCSLTAFQKHCFAARSVGGGLTATKGVLARSCSFDEVRGAILSPRCILVGHSWLHDLLQSFALRSQFVHRFVLHLQRVLKIIDHPLLNLLQLRDSILVGRADARMFHCLGRMRRRNI